MNEEEIGMENILHIRRMAGSLMEDEAGIGVIELVLILVEILPP